MSTTGVARGFSKFATVQQAVISTNTTGDNALVAGVVSKTIRMYRVFFVVDAATTLTWKDGATAKSGAMSMAANGAFVLDYDGEPWYVTTAGNALVLSQTGTAQISGTVYYKQD